MHGILKNTNFPKQSGWLPDIKGVNCQFCALPTSGADFQSALKGLEKALSSNADVESAAQAVRAAVEPRQNKGKQNGFNALLWDVFAFWPSPLMCIISAEHVHFPWTCEQL